MGISSMGDGYGQTPGQLGSMKPGSVEAVISSPPYEGSHVVHSLSPEYLAKFRAKEEELHGKGHSKNKYITGNLHRVNSEGQLGNDKGDTFWSAAKQIVAECHKILRDGGQPVQDGKNIIFCDCKK